MRFSAACLFSLMIAAGALADPPPELADVLARMASSSGVEVTFRERKELALLSAPLDSQGVIYFAPPDRFARFTLRPGFASLVVNGEKVHLREARDGEAIDASGNPLARAFVQNFVVLWSGDREQLESLYAAEFHIDADNWEIRLTPRRAPLIDVIAAITLRGDSETMREMIVEERDGDRTATAFESSAVDRVFTPRELQRIFVAGEPLEGARAER